MVEVWVWTLIAAVGLPFFCALTWRSVETWRIQRRLDNPHLRLIALMRLRARVTGTFILAIYVIIGAALLLQLHARGRILVWGLLASEVSFMLMLGVIDFVEFRRFDRIGSGKRWWQR